MEDSMDSAKKQFLSEKAAELRRLVIDAVYYAQSGHPGGSLSSAEIMTYLYFDKMNVSPDNPNDPDRDRFVLSKGHCCPALYAALALKGFYPAEDLKTFRHLGSHLQGHPDMLTTKGVDMSTGSLGQGFSAACGMAVSAKVFGKKYKVYTLLGDGECEEGQVWEAAMFASHYKLDNLTAFLDFNGYQIDGDIRQVLNPTPLDEKFKAFGWHVELIDGHSFDEIDEAVKKGEKTGKPLMIIAKTTKGKGVSYMENNYTWHGRAPKPEEYLIACRELDENLKRIRGER